MRSIYTIFLSLFINSILFATDLDSSNQNISVDAHDSSKAETGIGTIFNENSRKKIQLKINTDPANAVVTIDDSTWGLSSLTVTLDPGKHMVTLKKKGFYLKVAEIVLDTTSSSELNFVLQQPGSLLIMTEPSGALVFMNNQNIGSAPVVQKQLKPGKYLFKAELNGYEPLEQYFEVKSASTDTLKISLKHTSMYIDSVTAITNQKQKRSKKVHRGIVGGAFLLFGIILLGMEIRG